MCKVDAEGIEMCLPGTPCPLEAAAGSYVGVGPQLWLRGFRWLCVHPVLVRLSRLPILGQMLFEWTTETTIEGLGFMPTRVFVSKPGSDEPYTGTGDDDWGRNLA